MASAWLPYVAAGLSLYPLLSAYCLRRPMKRVCHAPLPSLQVQCSAHRGGAGERPENTMVSFAHAVQTGMQLLELDVHLTADGQVVVYHDATVDRLAEDGIRGAVESFAYRDLPPIRRQGAPLPPPFHAPGSRLGWTAPANASAADLKDAFTPPLLQDVIARFPPSSGVCFNIDVKDGSPELVDKVATIIEHHHAEGNVIWGSGKDRVAQMSESIWMYKRNPAIPMFASARSIALLYLKYLTGWLPFSSIRERAIEVPLITAHSRALMRAHGLGVDSTTGEPTWMSRLATGIFSRVSTSPTLIRHLQARNIKVIFWVQNHEDEFALAFDQLGADGVMTDFPSRLAQWMRKRESRQTQTGQQDGTAARNKSD